MTTFWNERYNTESFVYGQEPNLFFKNQLLLLQPGKILLPAEGEGRNAVFAAKNGWLAEAFDISATGKEKALRLAAQNNCSIQYQLGDAESVAYPAGTFDAAGLIYAHFTSDIRGNFHRRITSWLKPGGIVILEAFGKNHPRFQRQNPNVGGPGNPDALFSMEDIVEDFPNFEMITLEEKVIELEEGSGHTGTGSVIRFVGRKL